MRAADDFTAIRARMEQLQLERLGQREPERRIAARTHPSSARPIRRRSQRGRLGLPSETGSGWRSSALTRTLRSRSLKRAASLVAVSRKHAQGYAQGYDTRT